VLHSRLDGQIADRAAWVVAALSRIDAEQTGGDAEESEACNEEEENHHPVHETRLWYS